MALMIDYVMNSALKSVFAVLAIVAFIGFKVYNNVPRYHEEINEQVDLAGAEYMEYSFEPYESVKAKLEIDVQGSCPVTVVMVDEANKKKVEQQFMVGDFSFNGINSVMKSPGVIGHFEGEAQLQAAPYYVYMSNDSDTDPAKLTMTISSYQ